MSASLEAQETIGNYLIERPLAHGSMGYVYVARHTLTYARVALKVLRDELAADTQAEERFLREVRAAAQIGHEGIVKVHDAGRHHDGRLYLAMELLSGETLEERMGAEHGLRLAMMEWLASALEPLAAAHAQGIVHRDLKPANLFIARAADGGEHIKLLDFGLARDVTQKSGTETGIALGTPYYMSPEQATRPKQVGPASDVWSMGVMMYEVLCGQMPFDGETLHAVVIHATTKPHLALAAREPTLDPGLCELVEACLSKDPAQRPRDADELLTRLRPLLHDERIREALGQPLQLVAPTHAAVSRDRIPFADTAISFSPPRLLDSHMPHVSKRKQPRSPIALGAIAGAALLSLGLLWWLLHGSTRPTPAPVVAAPAPHVTHAETPPVQRPTPPEAPHPEATAPATKRAAASKEPSAARGARPQPAAPATNLAADGAKPGASAPPPSAASPNDKLAKPAPAAAPATDAPPPPAASQHEPSGEAASLEREPATAPPSEPLPPPDPPEPGASEP